MSSSLAFVFFLARQSLHLTPGTTSASKQSNAISFARIGYANRISSLATRLRRSTHCESRYRMLYLTHHCRGFMILILSTRLLLVKPRAQDEQGYAQAEQRQVVWQEYLDAHSLQHDAANDHDPVTEGIEEHQGARPIL